MKTYVFIFVPLQNETHFQECLRHCLARASDSETTSEDDEDSYPFWTWFLPNPRPTAHQSS